MTTVRLSDGATIETSISGAGRPVVFVHGWAMNGGYFDAQRRDLSGACKVITCDLRAHGGSTSPAALPTVERLAEDLIEIFDHLGLADAICVGWSMGAMVVWSALTDSAFARRVSGHAVIDMSPRISNDSTWRLGLSDGRRPLATIKAVEAMTADWPATVRRFVPRIFAAGGEAEKRPHIERMIEEANALDPEAMASLWESMAVQDFRAVIPALDLPMLVMRGDKSQLYSAATGEYVVRTARNAELAVFRASGHAPHIEEPEEFNRRLSRFIRQVPSTSTGRAPSIAPAG
jgi:pimeloyl-[acyl-carrier protein] methyl ester esterase